ncbi:thialysine N-epsilon-acetyltransferase-like isoform X2 [Carettochelys insculpta]|uniref:thialysine N-epsilon-acetyltransferase-like isoform X2 n=1 Tax=Carettochelys insculpta TaxID=44489 RepID=UPI003EC15167
MDCIVRPSEAADCGDVMRLIRDLAEFEQLTHQVQITEEGLRQDGFTGHPFYRCLVAEVPPESRSRDGHTIVGYGLYSFTYSTFKGRCIFMEDLYVMPEFRGKGIGKKLMRKIVEIGLENGCTQMRFMVLEWNRPAIGLYQGLGAEDLSAAEGWHFFCLQKDSMQRLAQGP